MLRHSMVPSCLGLIIFSKRKVRIGKRIISRAGCVFVPRRAWLATSDARGGTRTVPGLTSYETALSSSVQVLALFLRRQWMPMEKGSALALSSDRLPNASWVRGSIFIGTPIS